MDLVIATHNGFVHADEALAIAMLLILYPHADIIRTRDVIELANADIRVDVGGKDNPKTGDFDHHQKGGAGEREGVPFAAAGLVWKHFGAKIIQKFAPRFSPDQINRVLQMVDRELIQSVDAYDCGMRFELTGLILCTVNKIVRDMNPVWDEKQQDFVAALNQACEFCGQILLNEIQQACATLRAVSFVKMARREGWLKNGMKEVLIFFQYIHWNVWHLVVHDLGYDNILFGIVPGGGGWSVFAVPATLNTFNYRKLLPEAWAGLNDAELAKATGVRDAQYCHNGRWVCGARTREGALELARLAIAAE
jgi:uncharacterized UPF0160 family protein